jgi:hypothetical protein
MALLIRSASHLGDALSDSGILCGHRGIEVGYTARTRTLAKWRVAEVTLKRLARDFDESTVARIVATTCIDGVSWSSCASAETIILLLSPAALH